MTGADQPGHKAERSYSWYRCPDWAGGGRAGLILTKGLWYVNFSAQELFTFWGVASKTSFGEPPISHVLTMRFE